MAKEKEQTIIPEVQVIDSFARQFTTTLKVSLGEE